MDIFQEDYHAIVTSLWKKVDWLLDIYSALTFSVKSDRIFKIMKSFVNDLYDYIYTGEQAENNKDESGDDEGIDIKLIGDENATNANNENVIEID